MSAVLILDKYKELFKDEASFKKFAEVLGRAGQEDDLKFVLYDESLLVGLISIDEAEGKLKDRILRRLSKNPDIMDRLRERLESDDIVE